MMARSGISNLVVYILAVFASLSCIQGENTDGSKVTNDSKPEERIFGGEVATKEPREFPHHVFIKKLIGSSGKSYCGGSLLGGRWVLTSAFCVDRGANSLTITAGMHNGPDFGEGGTQGLGAESVFPHPCYLGIDNDTNHKNDIALVKLRNVFSFDNRRVATIQLDKTDRAKPGTQATAVGWGVSAFGFLPYPKELKKATFTLPKNEFCESMVPGIDIKSQQCVNDGAGYICDGDYGGGLLCKDGGVNYLCGIISYYLGGPGNTGRCFNASVFVRVSHYWSWINETMYKERNASQIDCVNTNGTGDDNDTLGNGQNPCIWNTNSPRYGFYVALILISFVITY